MIDSPIQRNRKKIRRTFRTLFYIATLLTIASLDVLETRAEGGASPGEKTQSLDGKWDFTNDWQLAGGQPPVVQPAVGQPAAAQPAGGQNSTGTWDSMVVPGNWDVQPAYSTYIGRGWYRVHFQVPGDWKGKHVRLCFGAVYNDALVTLNGAELGSHKGGYTPFEFDVTGKVAYGGDNVLLVCADNTTKRGAWWHWGGISRSVELIATGDVRLVWQHITSEPNLADGTAKISVHYKIANDSDSAKTVRVLSKINGASAPEATVDATVPAHGEAMADASFSLAKADVRLWDFDHPNLYSLATTLSESGAVTHGKTDRFGIRKIEAKPDGLYLNGERVRVAGFNRVSDSNQTGNTEPVALVRGDVDLMKRCGAVMERIMHFPQAPDLLDYLDEKGMLIFEEVPVWGGGDPNVKTNNPLTQQWLREMIERDYNHPCIIGWSPGNEISGHYAYVKSMFEFIRHDLDTSRLLSYASNTVESSNGNDPAAICDIIMVNKYGGFAYTVAKLHQFWPDKPIFFSEWGFKQIGAKPEAKLPGFEKGVSDTVTGNPFVIGFSIWTFNDYRSGFKNTPASGNREWGVIDVDRHPKAAYEQVRQAYSPVHTLAVAGGKIRIEPRSPDEVPSYALRGYKVKWESDPKKGEIPVPDLKPGDQPWETGIPAKSHVKVSLISPTGYDVADSEGDL